MEAHPVAHKKRKYQHTGMYLCLYKDSQQRKVTAKT